MNGWIAILFMWSAVFVGFSLASLARRFLVDDPRLVYPLTLQQVSVFKAMRNSFEFDSSTTRKQMRVFWYGILAFFCWQFLPEYAMPLVSSLTILCWVSSNPKVVFAGSGLGGVGFLNITLDWSNIGSSFIYQVSWSVSHSGRTRSLTSLTSLPSFLLLSCFSPSGFRATSSSDRSSGVGF